MRRDEFDKHVALGHANAEAIELVRRHCRHAHIELVDGNSMVGHALGLPMGLMHVRCEHAPPPTQAGSKALELAIDFYRLNCVGCPKREATGEIPNLAVVVAERDEEEAKQRAIEMQKARERADRHRRRQQQRQLAVAPEGYVIRDLAKWLDDIDGPEPRTDPLTPSGERAHRHIVETAKHAPQLFSDALVETLLGLAADTAEPVAFAVLEELVQTGHCNTRSAIEAALDALTVRAEPCAARLLSTFKSEFRQTDIPTVLDRLIEMSANQEEPWGTEPVPEGILAAAAIDLPTVSNRLIDLLNDNNDYLRGCAADTAALLLREDPKRVVTLGSPLISSIRGKDRGYAGESHPAVSATRALAQAWRGEPMMTVGLIEANAAKLEDEGKALLVQVLRFLQGWREPWDASEGAGIAAVEFCVRRLNGDWGLEAADEASRELESLSREVPHLVARNIDALIGVMLRMTAERPVSPLLADEPAKQNNPLEAMERASAKIARNARLRHIAETIGRAARVAPTSVLPRILPLLHTDLSEHEQAKEMRLCILDALEEALCADLLREFLPIAFTALLSTEPALRAKGIDLWAACARVSGGTLPEGFAYLAENLLADAYVIVHQRMLAKLGQLRIPAPLADRLIQIVAFWSRYYVDKPHVLEDSLWSLRYLAWRLDEGTCNAWLRIALELSPTLSPYDRERFLTAEWPQSLIEEPTWIHAAISTLAEPQLIDYYNQRREPLLAMLMSQPLLLTSTSFEEIATISDVYKPRSMRRALEPVELLQSAGRWPEAAKLARRVEEWQPLGVEGQRQRLFAALVTASTHLAAVMSNEDSTRSDDNEATAGLRQTLNEYLANNKGKESDDGRSPFLDSIEAIVIALEALKAPASTDPDNSARQLERAATMLKRAGELYGSGLQRQLLAEAWLVAALLHKYDACIRKTDPAAERYLASAQRNADVIQQRMGSTSGTTFPNGLSVFLSLVSRLNSAIGVTDACRVLATVPAPVYLIPDLESGYSRAASEDSTEKDEPMFAVCIATLQGSPVTDVLVLRVDEAYALGLTVWLSSWPEWADTCVIEPLSHLSQTALSLPKFAFPKPTAGRQKDGLLLEAQSTLHCHIEQAVGGPAFDCPLFVRFIGKGKEELAEVAGYRRLRLRPFDPSRDKLTQHEQTDQRLLNMYDVLSGPGFDTEDVRALCRLFTACVRAAQSIMFDNIFRKGSTITEAVFHNELERRLREDPELEGRISRRNAVAGGFDDLLHDNIVAELKVARDKAVTIEDCTRYLGQPVQYGVGRGSQLSILVVLDHSPKNAPPGVLHNYIGWLTPRLHGLEDPRYPSLVAVLIVSTNLPVPSAWSRRRIPQA